MLLLNELHRSATGLYNSLDYSVKTTLFLENRRKFDSGIDPLDPEEQGGGGHHHGFNPFGGNFKFHFGGNPFHDEF